MDVEILEFCIETEILDSTWNNVKQMIINNFNKKITKEEFRNKKQNYGEDVKVWIKEMVIMGKQANEDEESIMLTLNKNMRFKFRRELMVQLTNDIHSLITVCKKIEIIQSNIKNQYYKKNITNKKANYAKEFKNKFVKKSEIFKGFVGRSMPSGLLEINKEMFECMFDSGCKVNIIAKRLVEKCELIEYRCETFKGELIDGRKKKMNNAVDLTLKLNKKKYNEIGRAHV